MKIQTLVRLALQAIRKNKMRATLTMLGIIIGVAAVIVMVAIGSGARARISAQINNLGTNMIVITPGSANTAGVSQGAQAFPWRAPGGRSGNRSRCCGRNADPTRFSPLRRAGKKRFGLQTTARYCRSQLENGPGAKRKFPAQAG